MPKSVFRYLLDKVRSVDLETSLSESCFPISVFMNEYDCLVACLGFYYSESKILSPNKAATIKCIKLTHFFYWGGGGDIGHSISRVINVGGTYHDKTCCRPVHIHPCRRTCTQWVDRYTAVHIHLQPELGSGP